MFSVQQHLPTVLVSSLLTVSLLLACPWKQRLLLIFSTGDKASKEQNNFLKAWPSPESRMSSRKCHRNRHGRLGEPISSHSPYARPTQSQGHLGTEQPVSSQSIYLKNCHSALWLDWSILLRVLESSEQTRRKSAC